MDLEYEQFCKMDDARIRSIMDDAVEKLANGITSALNILNSQIILLCMDCGYWPEEYIRKLEQQINRKKFGNFDMLVPVKKTRFLGRTQVLGAACNAVNQVFYGELLL